MPEELGNTLDNLKSIEKTNYGDLEIFSGEWILPENSSTFSKTYVSLLWSGWGKVSSARAATRLIGHKFKESYIKVLFFTGVAGSINTKLKQWDIVVPNELIQHDMDARPIFEKYEIPALKTKTIKTNSKLTTWTNNTLKNFLENYSLRIFGNLYNGIIATGDRFISEKNDYENIAKSIKNVIAVEMEGASVAQVATQEGLPFQIIRVISDGANESSQDDFNSFISKYKNYSSKIISAVIENIDTAPL